MFISASCAVIVGSIITCIVRFPLWLSAFLFPTPLSPSLSGCLSVSMTPCRCGSVCTLESLGLLPPSSALRVFFILHNKLHFPCQCVACCSSFCWSCCSSSGYPLLLLLLLLPLPLLAMVSVATPSVSPPVAAAPPTPSPAWLARICMGNAFQLHFVFTTCSALCSFYGICWRCFALISFHCPRAAACLPPCSFLLVTLALEVRREWGHRKCARYQSRKSVHEANQNPTPSAMVSSLPQLLQLLLLLLIFHSCFRLHALNQFAR